MTASAVFRRRTRVHAPLETVWSFHSTLDGLDALTPALADLHIESVTGPAGNPDIDELRAGTTIELSIRPFGVGPRRSMTVRIDDRKERDGAAWFRDVMVSGPLPHWEHTHSFFADGATTIVDDHIQYALPESRIGRALRPAFAIGLSLGFLFRHRRTRRLLE